MHLVRVFTLSLLAMALSATSMAQDSSYIMRAGKMVGNYTMRPLLKRMPPNDATRYRAMLADA
jgi:hypothetical protein